MIPADSLANAIASFSHPENEIRERLQTIHGDVIVQSRLVRGADFRSIHTSDLEFLFEAYDRRFFAGEMRKTIGQRALAFHLSRRMTRAGGRTARITHRSGEVKYEIAIAISMLFDGFGENDRSVTVCGLPCESRLQALQRIFEHELVHLAEQLIWNNSNCSARRFQQIASKMFLHQAHTHNLITRAERAAESGIRVGALVSFLFEGRRLVGRVNRITKRATVLVEDAAGMRYSDGRRYKRYYVPIHWLEPAQVVAATA